MLIVGVAFTVIVNGAKIVNMCVLLIHFILVLQAKKYVINFRFNCNSSNFVHLLEFRVCCMQYVGSTVTPVRIRFNNWGVVSLMQVTRRHKLSFSAISMKKAIVDSWRISRLQSPIGLQVVIG